VGGSGGAADPDAGGGGFAEMDGLRGDAEGEGFVVATLEDLNLVTGKEVKTLEEMEEPFVFFINAEDDSGIARVKFGEENTTEFAELRNAAANGDAVRTGLMVCKAFKKEGLDFRRNGVLQTLGFGV
jgi:hypothetical protein